MSKVAIMTDTNSGMSKEECAEYGIFLVPMPITVNGKAYRESVDMDIEHIVAEMRAGSDVATSQATPGDVLSTWDQIADQGYDEAVYIPMSSGLNHAYATACGLAPDFRIHVALVDDHRISVTQRESTLDALDMAKLGWTADQIKSTLEANALNAGIYIALDTLDWLKRGGRITPAGAALGTLLRIKPIMQIQGEKLDAYAKMRNMKSAISKIVEACLSDRTGRFADIPDDRIRLRMAGCDPRQSEIDSMKAQVHEAMPGIEVSYHPLSAGVNCHIGPGALGCAIMVKPDLALGPVS